ncbi:MAG: phosphoribosylamine--glycine ligase, partial [Alistipes sp.]|nr:phosphoribosylamine--glycine ligase [Alistipes sp.]
MNVLVIGSGGREHAIVEAISRSPKAPKIYAAPGNAGISQLAECVAIKDTEVAKLVEFAKNNNVELTVVGPEASLAAGVVDAFRAEGLKIFGPTKAAAEIEASKDFAKRLMVKYDVPTAGYATFSDFEEALAYVRRGTL